MSLLRSAAILAVVLAGCGDDSTIPRDGGVPDGGADWPTGWVMLTASPHPHGIVTPGVLPDGRIVLVSGDDAAFAPHLQAFDPATQTWDSTAEFISMANETSTPIPTGDLLVVGAALSDESTSDPRLRLPWAPGFRNSVLLIGADLVARPGTPTNVMRAAHAAVRLESGGVLVAGGATLESDSGPVVTTGTAEIYDPDAATWTPTASLAQPRLYHTATVLQSGAVLVVGGRDMGGTFFTSAEIYDPDAGSWRTVAPMTTPRSGHAAVLLGSGRVLVAGGVTSLDEATATAEVYDPTTDSWEVVPPLGRPAAWPAYTALPSGDALVVGGAASDQLSAHGQAAIFVEPSMDWVSMADIPGGMSGMFTYEGRFGAGAVLLPDRRVVIIGGNGRGGISAREPLISDGAFPQ